MISYILLITLPLSHQTRLALKHYSLSRMDMRRRMHDEACKIEMERLHLQQKAITIFPLDTNTHIAVNILVSDHSFRTVVTKVMGGFEDNQMELSFIQTWGVGLGEVTIFSVQITTLIPLGLSLSCWVLRGRAGCHHSSQGVFLAVFCEHICLLAEREIIADIFNHCQGPSCPFGWLCMNKCHPPLCCWVLLFLK